MIEADKLRGTYIDRDAGRITFKKFAEDWLAAQTFEATTREAVTLRLRLHAYPDLGHRTLAQIRPSTVQAWLSALPIKSPSYRRTVFANVSAILGAAVDDERIAKNPCKAPSVKPPRVEPRKVIPWEGPTVAAVAATLPHRY